MYHSSGETKVHANHCALCPSFGCEFFELVQICAEQLHVMRGVVKITDVLEDCKVGALGSKCKCDIVSQFSQTAFSCVLCLFGLLSSSSLKSTD